ncbi:MAG: hypothetical protein CMH54_15790 [Myxococcales bacterium]|nr:hypothetical protein [Myxococcales bacterium]
MTLLYFILMIGGLIFFHELGHYVMARLTGVHVEIFSIGFGPAIFKWKGKPVPVQEAADDEARAVLAPTEYQVAIVPLGGYVKLFGDQPGETILEEVRLHSFAAKSLWRRFLIVFGGPLFNLILPFILFFGVGFATQTLRSSEVGSVRPGGPAGVAGLQAADRIVAIDGDPVHYWWEIREKIRAKPGQKVMLTYERDGQRRGPVELTPDRVVDPELRRLGIHREIGIIGIGTSYPLPVLSVAPGSVAYQAGLRDGDCVRAMDGREVKTFGQLERRIQEHVGESATLTLERRRPVLRWLTSRVPMLDKAIQVGMTRQSDAPAALIRTQRCSLNPAKEDLVERSIPIGSGTVPGLRSGEFVISTILPDSPAAKAGLQPGDQLDYLQIPIAEGSPITRIQRYASFVGMAQPLSQRAMDLAAAGSSGKSGPGPMTVGVVRNGESLELKLAPGLREVKTAIKTNEKVIYLGLDTYWERAEPARIVNNHRWNYASHVMMNDTVEAIYLTVMGIKGLFTGQISFKENVGGPIMVYNLAEQTEKQGWMYFFQIMAVLSISLGLINLLPIPVLDGGHILFILVEAIQRKPISMRVRQTATYVGLTFVLLLMIMVFKNDIERNWSSIAGFFGG